MKKQLGISRNRIDRLQSFKQEAQRKKNRFQIVGKEESEDYNSNQYKDSAYSLTTTNSDPCSQIELTDDTDQQIRKLMDLHRQSRNYLKKATQLQKKMGDLSKARLVSLRQKENEKYDQSIAKLANEATSAIMAAEGQMRKISAIEFSSSASKKMLQSMQVSLASQIQSYSRSLRNQEKNYFQRVKAIQKGTINSAIQLTAQQRKSMEGEQEQIVEENQQDIQNGRVKELVSSISKLSSLYKDLGNLVVTQGTVIDRIDFNLQETETHTAKAVQHLKGADEHVSSQFADKIIKTLALTIILMAIILCFKYMK